MEQNKCSESYANILINEAMFLGYVYCLLTTKHKALYIVIFVVNIPNSGLNLITSSCDQCYLLNLGKCKIVQTGLEKCKFV